MSNEFYHADDDLSIEDCLALIAQSEQQTLTSSSTSVSHPIQAATSTSTPSETNQNQNLNNAESNDDGKISDDDEDANDNNDDVPPPRAQSEPEQLISQPSQSIDDHHPHPPRQQQQRRVTKKKSPSQPRRSALQIIEHLLSKKRLLPSTTNSNNNTPARLITASALRGSTAIFKNNNNNNNNSSDCNSKNNESVKKEHYVISTNIIGKSMISVVMDNLTRRSPLENENENKNDETTNKKEIDKKCLLVCICDPVVPGAHWMKAGPLADHDEVDLFTSSDVYPQMIPGEIDKFLPLKYDSAILLHDVSLYRTGEGARMGSLPPDSGCSVLFVPYISIQNTDKKSTTSTSSGGGGGGSYAHHRTLTQQLSQAMEGFGQARNDIHSSILDFMQGITGVANGFRGRSQAPSAPAPNTDSSSGEGSNGAKLADQFRFILECAAHHQFEKIILPLNRWARTGHSPVEVAQRLSQALDSFQTQREELWKKLGSSAQQEKQILCIKELHVVCPPESEFWQPGVKSVFSSAKVRRSEDLKIQDAKAATAAVAPPQQKEKEKEKDETKTTKPGNKNNKERERKRQLTKTTNDKQENKKHKSSHESKKSSTPTTMTKNTEKKNNHKSGQLSVTTDGTKQNSSSSKKKTSKPDRIRRFFSRMINSATKEKSKSKTKKKE